MSRRGRPVALGPVDWRVLVRAFDVTCGVLETQAPSGPPPPPAPDAGGPSPRLREIVSALQAITDGRGDVTMSCLARVTSLMDLMQGGGLEGWVIRESGPDGTRLRPHPALLIAAAEVKLTRRRRLPPRKLVARAEAVMREEGLAGEIPAPGAGEPGPPARPDGDPDPPGAA